MTGCFCGRESSDTLRATDLENAGSMPAEDDLIACVSDPEGSNTEMNTLMPLDQARKMDAQFNEALSNSLGSSSSKAATISPTRADNSGDMSDLSALLPPAVLMKSHLDDVYSDDGESSTAAAEESEDSSSVVVSATQATEEASASENVSTPSEGRPLELADAAIPATLATIDANGASPRVSASAPVECALPIVPKSSLGDGSTATPTALHWISASNLQALTPIDSLDITASADLMLGSVTDFFPDDSPNTPVLDSSVDSSVEKSAVNAAAGTIACDDNDTATAVASAPALLPLVEVEAPRANPTADAPVTTPVDGTPVATPIINLVEAPAVVNLVEAAPVATSAAAPTAVVNLVEETAPLATLANSTEALSPVATAVETDAATAVAHVAPPSSAVALAAMTPAKRAIYQAHYCVDHGNGKPPCNLHLTAQDFHRLEFMRWDTMRLGVKHGWDTKDFPVKPEGAFISSFLFLLLPYFLVLCLFMSMLFMYSCFSAKAGFVLIWFCYTCS